MIPKELKEKEMIDIDKEYFDFVLVEMGMGRFLHRAPACSKLERGDAVLCETWTGTDYGTVISIVTLSKNDIDAIDFIMKATKSGRTVNKVLAKVNFKCIQYDKDEL